MRDWGRFVPVITALLATAVAFGADFDPDGDGDVDLMDYQVLHGCLEGPEVAVDGICLTDFDPDGDGDVDLADVRAFQAAFTGAVVITETQLAGNALSDYPYFEYVKAFNADATVEVALDPTRFPDVVGETADLYIVAAKNGAEWNADLSLTDVRTGGPDTVAFAAGGIQANTFLVAGAGELSADAGIGLGVGYDVVLDFDQDGQLDSGDYIDGFGDEAGLYVVHDTTQPGPLAVTEVIYSGGTWLGQDTYYPTAIAGMGELPLIVISHGNGHDYTWYDHIGYHMASYGYVVMAHQNNTSPGIETASTTTLTNTDYLLGNQATIAGGVLNGHLDSHRIVWIGHSRGAEGITRAYDRIYDGSYTPQHFTLQDILLLSSMLPTDFLGTGNSTPHGANYHLWTASGDADVDGSASCDLCQTFHLHDRATGFRHSTVVQGTGHAWFHDAGGTTWFDGPCPIYESNTHLVQLGYFLPLIKHYVEGNIPATDFFWRQYESFRPIGVGTGGSCSASGGDSIVVNNTYHNGAPCGNFVIDDFQSQFAADRSSSGGTVSYDVASLTEDRLDDGDSSLTWTTGDPMNGMTYGSDTDVTRGVVFEWNGSNRYYEQTIVAGGRDFSPYTYLSFRACQGTRHPNTTAELSDLDFSVMLRDGSGASSTINIAAYGGGIEEPYQRTGDGSGTGWANEFETIRIRLTDFMTNGTELDLTDISSVRFIVGPAHGSAEGRLGLDDIELTSDRPPNVFIGISLPEGPPIALTPGQSTEFPVEIIARNETYILDTGTLHYRYDGGEFTSVPLEHVSGALYTATLPPADCADAPQFYLSAQGSESGLVVDPPGAPAVFYEAEVGEFAVFFEETMESSPGWTTQGLWAFGQPTGQGGQYGEPDPTSGYTGDNVYGYNLNGDYENGLVERHLTTPRHRLQRSVLRVAFVLALARGRAAAL